MCTPGIPSDWDHPRTRGEYLALTLPFWIAEGSPPHTRGIHFGVSVQRRCHGITPAHAGNTALLLADTEVCRDHPRTRGEYCECGTDSIENGGSPPHTRGILESVGVEDKKKGITPAHAGNTRFSCFPLDVRRDHPRTRGEYKLLRKRQRSAMGSPPHTRGIPTISGNAVTIPGITPAHAGNTKMSCFSLLPSRDHPRTRGEYSPHPKLRPDLTGSPPHTRGIRKHK